MTVSYSREVFTSTGSIGIFLKLLARWRGSIYRLVWHDLLIYVTLYFILSCTYRFALNEQQRRTFESISLHCNNYGNLIPVTFVLGFYVSIIIARWWNQFELLPWPDSASVWISSCLHGHDDRGRLMRRTIVRYLNLGLILTMRLVSVPAKKRFPTLEHLVEAGILLDSEKKIIENMDLLSMNHPKYWMPLVWAGSIITRARKEDRITDDYAVKALIEKIDEYRSLCGGLLNYDWIQIPLVYTQVVTLAVYSFLLTTLMGRQFLDPSQGYKGYEVDLIIPIFTFLQFFFYMGWLKVAEALINPFGEDDDDFDVNWLIDRNLQVSYLIVDEMHQEHPDLIRDQFWDDVFPELPYTAAAEDTKIDPIIGAAAMVEIPDDEAEFLPLNENDDDDIISNTSLTKSEKIFHKNDDNLVIDMPSIKSKGVQNMINNSHLMPKVDSAITFRTEHGSTSSLGKVSSVVSSMMAKLGHGKSHTQSGDGKMFMGSNASLFSKNSRRRRKRQQRLGRSVSRISNTSDPQSPRDQPRNVRVQRGFLRVRRETLEGLSRSPSLSSLNSHLVRSDSEGSLQPSTKPDMNDVLKEDMRTYRRQLSSSSIGRQTSKVKRGMVMVNNDALQNKILRQKMEMIQTLQHDIMEMLDQELECDDYHVTEADDPSDLVHALEIRTELLRKQMLRRNRLRGCRTTSGSYSPQSELIKTLDSEANEEVIEELASSSRKDSLIHQESYPDEVPSQEGSYRIPFQDNKEEPMVPHPPKIDVTTDLAALVEQPNPDYDPNVPFVKPIETEPSSNEETSYEIELSTIEEQPEYGYQSDSSDTEMLLPKQVGLNEKKTTSRPATVNLPTLAEEDSNEIEVLETSGNC